MLGSVFGDMRITCCVPIAPGRTAWRLNPSDRRCRPGAGRGSAGRFMIDDWHRVESGSILPSPLDASPKEEKNNESCQQFFVSFYNTYKNGTREKSSDADR